MFNYIQIDERGLIVGVSQLAGEITAPNYYRVDEYNAECLGQHYNEQTGEITPEPPTDETSV